MKIQRFSYLLDAIYIFQSVPSASLHLLISLNYFLPCSLQFVMKEFVPLSWPTASVGLALQISLFFPRANPSTTPTKVISAAFVAMHSSIKFYGAERQAPGPADLAGCRMPFFQGKLMAKPLKKAQQTALEEGG